MRTVLVLLVALVASLFPTQAMAATDAQRCIGETGKGFRVGFIYAYRKGDSHQPTKARNIANKAADGVTDKWMNVSRGTKQKIRWLCNKNDKMQVRMIEVPRDVEHLGHLRNYLIGLRPEFDSSRRIWNVFTSWSLQGCDFGCADPTDHINVGRAFTYFPHDIWNDGALLWNGEPPALPPVLMHEFTHTLSAVNRAAPGARHDCDGGVDLAHTCQNRDLMFSYNDPAKVQMNCRNVPFHWLDCGEDTYYNPGAGPHDIGTKREWLYRNACFNVAASRFLTNVGLHQTCSPGGEPNPEPPPPPSRTEMPVPDTPSSTS